MTSLLALMAAVIYGAADFLGGTVARRASTLAAVIATQGAGLVLLLLGIPLMLDAVVTTNDVVFGALAGVTGSVGVGLLYRGLAMGPMSIVAPVTAVCAVVVPLIAGLIFGERLVPAAALGVALAIAAVVLLGQAAPGNSPAHEPPRSAEHVAQAVRIALASGVAIGGFFVCLGRTQAPAGLWPLAVSRAVSVSLFLGVALLRKETWRIPVVAIAPAVSCGALDMVANGLYLVAVRQGQLSLVATLASLYPASTVLLARVVLGERLGRWQKVGVVTAVAATALIAASS
ncbi:MAG TPA: EamA family transporter [Vicinamibacterales bacterium]|nr:EamA family transporter [Vicinamibacterales bacterium]